MHSRFFLTADDVWITLWDRTDEWGWIVPACLEAAQKNRLTRKQRTAILVKTVSCRCKRVSKAGGVFYYETYVSTK